MVNINMTLLLMKRLLSYTLTGYNWKSFRIKSYRTNNLIKWLNQTNQIGLYWFLIRLIDLTPIYQLPLNGNITRMMICTMYRKYCKILGLRGKDSEQNDDLTVMFYLQPLSSRFESDFTYLDLGSCVVPLAFIYNVSLKGKYMKLHC